MKLTLEDKTFTKYLLCVFRSMLVSCDYRRTVGLFA